MDKKFRIKGKVGVIDIFFIIVIIAGLFFLRDFAAPQSVTAAPEDVKIKYVVELYRKDVNFIDNVAVGERLYDIERGYEIGVITGVYDAPFLEDSPDFENKTYKRAPVEGLSYVYVEVEAVARITEMATNIGQYQVMVGKEAFIRSRSFSSGGYVVILERL